MSEALNRYGRKNIDKPTIVKNGAEALDVSKFEEHRHLMREAAVELISVQKELNETIAERTAMNVPEKDTDKWIKVNNQHNELLKRKTELLTQATWGSVKLLGPAKGSHQEYNKLAMSDPVTVLYLAKSGGFFFVRRPNRNEGFYQVNVSLRSNVEYMTRILNVLSTKQARYFWAYCRGEAQDNKALFLATIRKNPNNYIIGPDKWKDDPEVQRIAIESADLESKLPKK